MTQAPSPAKVVRHGPQEHDAEDWRRFSSSFVPLPGLERPREGGGHETCESPSLRRFLLFCRNCHLPCTQVATAHLHKSKLASFPGSPVDSVKKITVFFVRARRGRSLGTRLNLNRAHQNISEGAGNLMFLGACRPAISILQCGKSYNSN